MMQTLFFCLALVAVTLLVIWMVRNDRLKPDEPMTGLFAMRKPAAPQAPKTGSNPRHGGLLGNQALRRINSRG
jgi:hypothetical protein